MRPWKHRYNLANHRAIKMALALVFVSCKVGRSTSDEFASTHSTSGTLPRIGITDTLYAQIRYAIEGVGAQPIELTTLETMKEMFLEGTPPALLTGSKAARVVYKDLFQGPTYTMRRWDVSTYMTPGGTLDRYLELHRPSVRTPSVVEFLAPLINMNFIRKEVEKLDGLVLGGGEDVNPRLYLAKDFNQVNTLGDMEGNEYARTRDIIELSYIAEAIRQGKPVLGICRGSQILAVALGGRLLQDIPTAHPEIGNRHFMSKELDRSEGHSIRIPVDSAFARILKLSSNEHSRDVLRSGSDYVIAVNSYHHQSVLDEFPEIQVQARDNVSTKGVLKPVIEGFLARSTSALVMGVQFHPERPFAQNSQTIDAVNTSRKDWQVWFDSDKRRPYYRHIFENFVACAKKDTKKCQR